MLNRMFSAVSMLAGICMTTSLAHAYDEKSPTCADAVGRTGVNYLIASATLGSDGKTAIKLTTADCSSTLRGFGTISKIQIKSKQNGVVNLNALNLPGDTSVSVQGFPAGEELQIMVHLTETGSNRSRTYVLTTDVLVQAASSTPAPAPVPVAKPDLAIDDLQMPEFAETDSVVGVSANVHEIGGSDASADCVLLVNGEERERHHLSVAKLGTGLCHFSMEILECGDHEVEVTVDSAVPQEDQLANNTAFALLSASDPEPVAPADGYWAKRFGDSAMQQALSVVSDANLNVYVSGLFYSAMDTAKPMSTATPSDAFIVKVDGAGRELWSKQIGGAGVQLVTASAVDSDGNLIVAGRFTTSLVLDSYTFTSLGAADIFMAKLSPSGAVLWARQFGGPLNQYANDIAIDSGGNIVLAGYMEGSASFGGPTLTSAGADDILVAKFDADGNHLWSKRFGDASATQQAIGIATDANGNVLVTGKFSGSVDFSGSKPQSTVGVIDSFLLKLDGSGTHLWSRTFGNPRVSAQNGQAVAADDDGNVVLLGTVGGKGNFGGGFIGNDDSTDIYLAKYDSNGNYLWANVYGNGCSGTCGYQYASDLSVEHGTGNIVLAGYGNGTVDFGTGALNAGYTGNDIFVGKVDANGRGLWGRRLGDSANSQQPASISLDMNGNVLMAGQIMGSADFRLGGTSNVITSAGHWDAFVAKLQP